MERYEMHTGIYRKTAEHLLRFTPKNEGPILELGSRTGNFTIATAQHFDKSQITGLIWKEKEDRNVDVPAMLSLAKMKFGFEDPSGLVKRLFAEGDCALGLFLLHFSRDAKQYAMRVEFVNQDFFSLQGKEYPAVVAHQFMHWFEGESAQRQFVEKLAEMTCRGGYASLSSAMAFYAPKHFKAEDVSYLQHPFVLKYFEILAGKVSLETGKLVEQRKQKDKKQAEETIALFESGGFVLHSYNEMPSPDIKPEALFNFALQVAPENNGMFDAAPQMPAEIKTRLINEALQEAVKRHLELLPSKGIPCDLTPVFVFRRR